MTTLSASLEDYLETIYNLVEEKKVARVKDIAQKMNVTMPAVTGALKHLNSKNFVKYNPYEYIELTPAGEEVAEKIVNRHKTIKKFLIQILNIPSEKASENACRMEHVMDDIILKRLVKFIDFVEESSRSGDNWLEKFNEYCEEDQTGDEAIS
jgi:DtxR family Mn-dependent transcriptional regulator